MKIEASRTRKYFIDLYLERFVPSHYELKLVPTYRCNLDCSYCYARPFRKRYPEDMSRRTFRALVDGFVAEGGRFVRFLGGEPALWRHIGEAMVHLRELGLRTFVLTNGTVALDELPDEIHLNVEHYCKGRLRRRVIDVLKSYRSRKALVRFRYNIQPSDTTAKLEDILDLAARYAVPSVHLGTAWPHEKTRRFGRQVVDTVRRIRARGVGCTLGDPMPFCLFTEEERDELCETANFSGRCMCGHIPLVNPDGESVFPCQAVDTPRSMPDLGALRNVRRGFRHEVGHVVRAVEKRCLSCRHFLDGECQDGCLGDRVDLLDRSGKAGGLGRVVEKDVLIAATTAEIPSACRGGGGWSSWRQGGGRVSCRVRRGVQDFRRGDRIVTRRATDRRPSLGVLLGLPGEVLALTADGSLYIQDLFEPRGARLTPFEEEGRWLAGVVEETSVFDLGELEVLVTPALSGEAEAAPVRTAGAVMKLPLDALVGRVTRFAGSASPRRTQWIRIRLAGTPEVSDLALTGEPIAASSAGSLRAAFALRAPMGTIAEVELIDAKTYRPLARGQVFQPSDGLVHHVAPLELTQVRFRRGRCLLSVHAGGKVLSAREENAE
jgi:MoaA/NifB/PqqE/SkfB family radical SAM enzyme